MKPIAHPSNTRAVAGRLGPGGKPVEQSIAITDAHLRGEPVVVSYWQPSPDELSKILRGWPVALVVSGREMPGALVMVMPPAGATLVN